MNTLTNAILRGAFQPGERLNESEIAQQLNTSRGPVREALRQLEEARLVIHIPYKGCFVKEYGQREIEEIWKLRTLLEGFAATLAAKQASDDAFQTLSNLIEEMQTASKGGDLDSLVDSDFRFHEYLVKLANHELLYGIWRSLKIQTQRFLYLQPDVYDTLDKVAESHLPILHALRARDGVGVRNAVEAHIKEIVDLGIRKESPAAKGWER